MTAKTEASKKKRPRRCVSCFSLEISLARCDQCDGDVCRSNPDKGCWEFVQPKVGRQTWRCADCASGGDP